MKTKTTLFLCSILCCSHLQTKAQTEIKKFVGTNGSVYSILQNGDTTYIGGLFTLLGINVKGLARFKPGNTKPDVEFPELGGRSGIYAIVSDDEGGSYLSGYFDEVDSRSITPTHLIHILANGVLDSSFKPVNLIGGGIYALKRKNNKLYIGGNFSSIQDSPRTNLAALNARSGALDNWIPDFPDNGIGTLDASDSCIFISGNNITNVGGFPVPFGFAGLNINSGKVLKNLPQCQASSFTVDKNTLYLGGSFTDVGNFTRGLAKISSLSTAQDANYPFTDGQVIVSLPDGKGGYFMGGYFTRIGNTSRKNIAHILPDGSIDSLFNLNINSDVRCLASDGINLYIGGYFTAVNGITRNRIASVLLSDATLTNFNPSISGAAVPMVNSIIYHAGTLYFGGHFSKVNNIKRNNIAAVTVSNVLKSWNPNVSDMVDDMVANRSGTSLFVCGAFTKIKGVSHPYVAKLSTKTGDVDTWLPSPNAEVQDLALNNNILYISGNFSTINNTPRYYLAALDTSINTPTSFKADADATPYDLFINSGKLYVAGSFTTLQDSSRNYIARINIATGLVDSWNSGNTINPDFGVVCINANDSVVIIGGGFYRLNVKSRNHLAAINVSNNNFELKDWNPAVSGFNVKIVYDVLHYGTDVFASGDLNYQYPDGQYMLSLISLNDSTGVVSRKFLQYTTGSIFNMKIFDNKLMVTGNFPSFRDLDGSKVYVRTNFAGYDLNTNILSSSTYEPNGAFYGFDTDTSGNLIAGGDFTLMNCVYRNNLAAFNTATGLPISFAPNAGDAVRALALKDTTLFVGGDFMSIGKTPVLRKSIAAINTNTGETTPWKADANSQVFCLALKDSVLYAGGLFSSINGIPRNYGAAISTSGTGKVLPWNPNTNDIIYAVLPVHDSVYIGGSFNSVNGVYKPYLAKCDNTNGSASKWSPQPSGSIYTVSASATTMYAGGSFNLISNASRYNLAAFDIATDTLKPLNLIGAATVTTSALSDKYIYIGLPKPSLINGVLIGNVAAADTISGAASDFNPYPQIGEIQAVSVSNKVLFAGGTGTADDYYPSYFSTFTLQHELPATDLNFTNVQPTSVTAHWVNGSGENRIAVVKQGASPSIPKDGKKYKADTSFANGQQTRPKSYVVYNGPDSSVKVVNLLPNHSYTFDIFEYKGQNSTTDYLQNPFLTGVVKTACTQYLITLDSSGSLNICPADSVRLTAPLNFSSYLWSTGDSGRSITVHSPGSYYVTATDSNKCKAIAPAVSVNIIPCKAPSGLIVSNITSRNATLSWQPVECSIEYQYQYRRKGTTFWVTGSLNGSSKSLTGLKPLTTYQWRVLAICKLVPDTLFSSYTTGDEFTTTSSFANLDNSLQNTFTEDFNAYVYPNPSTVNAIVYIQGNISNLSVVLKDLNGRILWQKANIVSSKISIPIKNIPNAVYFIDIRNGQQYKILQLVKLK